MIIATYHDRSNDEMYNKYYSSLDVALAYLTEEAHGGYKILIQHEDSATLVKDVEASVMLNLPAKTHMVYLQTIEVEA